MFSQKDIQPMGFRDSLIQLKAQGHFHFVFISIILAAFIFLQPTSARAASVTLSATPTSRTINAGQSTTYTININRDNYTGSVTLSASNLPKDATFSFNPNPTTGKSSTLTITTKTTTPTGTYQIKVSGSATGLSIAPINAALTIKPTPSVTITAIPATQSIIAGQSTSYRLQFARSNYTGPITLSVSGLPNGISAVFEPNPANGDSSAMRIYSHGYPHVQGEIFPIIRAVIVDGPISEYRVRTLINCGIEYVEQFGSNAADIVKDVAVDGSGNIYVVGDTIGTIDPNNCNNDPQQCHQGVTDVWVAKYNAAFQRQWIRQLGTNNEDRVTEVAVDTAGNVFMGGYTDGIMPNNSPIGGFDFWIAKYDGSGVRQWVAQSGSIVEDGAGGFEIVPDNQGGGQLTTFENDRASIKTYSFAANNGSLVQQLSRSVTQQFRDGPNDLALAPDGSVYIVGKFRNELIPNMPHDDGYLIRYDSQGNRDWIETIQNLSAATDENVMRVVVDASGNIYVAVKAFHRGSADAWLRKYDSAQHLLWFTEEGSPTDDFVNALAINNDGDLIVAGMTRGSLGEQNPDGNDDAFVEKRSGSTGSLVWVKQFPVVDADGFNAVAVTSQNKLLLGGYTVAWKSGFGSKDALLLRYADSFLFPNPILPPSISSLSPSTGAVGAEVSIKGNNFDGVTGVRFNGIPASFTIITTNEIKATVPQGATSGLITVSKGCESVTSQSQFTVQ